MATEARKLQVGAFVIGAVVIGVSAAIWLGASRYFTDESMMVTYFAESVQGLDPGSSVKYRGVPAGRVETIRIAPDGELIEVIMSIDTHFAESLREDSSLRAQLQLAGITGLRYVEIDRHSGDALQKAPDLSFGLAYPLIPSTPSSFMAIQEALVQIYDKVMSIDLEGISDDARTTLQAADQVLRDDRVQRILSSMAELTESASRVTLNVESITEDVQLAPAVKELRQTTAEARGLIGDLREGRTGQQLRDTLREVASLARSIRELVVGLQGAVDRLDRTAGNVELLTDQLTQQPSRLIFSEPPAPRRPADRVQ